MQHTRMMRHNAIGHVVATETNISETQKEYISNLTSVTEEDKQ